MNQSSIRSAMGYRFWRYWQDIYAKAGALPSDAELCAQPQDWLTPYLVIFDLEIPKQVRFVTLGEGWRDWWSLDGSLDTLKINAAEDRLDAYWRAVLEGAAHPCGLLEDSIHVFPSDQRQQKIDSVALPLRPARGSKATVAIFSIVTTMNSATADMKCEWFDIGSGVPENSPPT